MSAPIPKNPWHRQSAQAEVLFTQLHTSAEGLLFNSRPPSGLPPTVPTRSRKPAASARGASWPSSTKASSSGFCSRRVPLGGVRRGRGGHRHPRRRRARMRSSASTRKFGAEKSIAALKMMTAPKAKARLARSQRHLEFQRPIWSRARRACPGSRGPGRGGCTIAQDRVTHLHRGRAHGRV